MVLLSLVLYSPAAEASTGCHRSGSDAAAKELVRSAQAAAEAVAVDNGGSYQGVSRASLHSAESLIPITPRQAARWSGAYLLSASGTADSYVVTARASDGNTFTVRDSNGTITQTALICGKARRW